MIFNVEMETLPREKMAEVQLKRLQETVKRVYERVPFHQKAFDEAGVKPEDIQTLDDIQKLPFMKKKICARIILSIFLQSI